MFVPYFSKRESKFTVRVGSSAHDEDGTIHVVTGIIRHPYYNASNYDNDIALFNVSPHLELGTSTVNNITWATERDRISPGDPAIVSGWGYVENNTVSTSYELL